MTPLAYVDLEINRQLRRIYNGIVNLPGYVNQPSCFLISYMPATRTMTPFTVDSIWNTGEIILRSNFNFGKSIVATHALKSDLSFKARIMSIFKAGWQIPFLLLRIISQRSLVEVAIHTIYMRICMLS